MKLAFLELYEFILLIFTPYYEKSFETGNLAVIIFSFVLSITAYISVSYITKSLKELFFRRPTRQPLLFPCLSAGDLYLVQAEKLLLFSWVHSARFSVYVSEGYAVDKKNHSIAKHHYNRRKAKRQNIIKHQCYKLEMKFGWNRRKQVEKFQSRKFTGRKQRINIGHNVIRYNTRNYNTAV